MRAEKQKATSLVCILIALALARSSYATEPPATQAASSPAAAEGPARGQVARWLRSPPPDAPQPKLECTRPKIEGLSTIAGDTLEWSWEVANVGTAELRLWLTAWWDHGAVLQGPRWRVVPPGERAAIVVSYAAPPEQCGTLNVQWNASTNDAATRVLDLRAVVEVRPRGSVEEHEATYGPCGDVERWLAPPPETAPQPQLVCAQTTADLGDVWPGTGLKPAWTFENVGAAPLRILLQVDCCTAVKPGTLIIAPGQRTTVAACLVCRRPGEISRKAKARTNDAAQPEVTLHLKAVHHEALRMAAEGQPSRGVSFDKVPRDAGPQTKTVLLTRGDGGPLRPRVRKITTDEESLTPPANVTAELRELEPGERYELDVTVTPPWPEGKEWARAKVELETGVAEQPTAEVSVLVKPETP